ILAVRSVAAAGGASGGLSGIKSQELKEWLSYIASDDLEGRALYGTGIGLAAAYIEDHLQVWGLKPAGDRGSYGQTVRVLGVKTTSHATVTVSVAGESRSFADGDGITLPRNMGGKRRFIVDRVEFTGYGVDAPAANHVDYRDKDMRGAAVVWLGSAGPKGLDQSLYRRLLGGRSRYATEQLGAAAAIGPAMTAAAGGASGPGRSGASGAAAGPGGGRR